MRILILLLVFAGWVPALSAQAASPVGPVSPAGLTARHPAHPLPVGIQTDSVRHRQSGRTVAFSHAGGQEVGRRRKPSVLGGVAGFLVGGAVGGVLGCLANKDDYGVFCGGQSDTTVFLGVALGGAVGGTLGALLFARER